MCSDKPKVIALLLAGGCGLRMHSSRPKQFIEVHDESILLHTMRAFERHPLVDGIYVVCAPEWSGYVQKQAAIGHVDKFRRTLTSGTTSHASLLNGIEGLRAEGMDGEAIVMVHDGVRPFVSHETITDNIQTCREKGNAVTATFSHESYICTDDGKEARGYVPRERLMRAQTPITFRMKDLEEIVRLARSKGIAESQSLFTLVNEIDRRPLHIVEGNILNFKITVPLELEMYSRLHMLQS